MGSVGGETECSCARGLQHRKRKIPSIQRTVDVVVGHGVVHIHAAEPGVNNVRLHLHAREGDVKVRLRVGHALVAKLQATQNPVRARAGSSKQHKGHKGEVQDCARG